MSELHKFLFEGLPVRGMLVRLTDSWQEVLKRRLGNDLLGAVALDHSIGEALAYGQNPLLEPGFSPACRDMRVLSDTLKAQLKSMDIAESYAS